MLKKETRKKLTKTVVDKLSPPGEGKDEMVWDSELPGFGVRLQGNKAAWCVMYRHAGRKRRITLGAVRALAPEAARRRAKATFGLST